MVHLFYLIPQVDWTMKSLLRCFMPLEKYGLERSTKSTTRRPKKWIEKDYKGALSSRGRSRMFQNLRNCPAVDAKTMCCFAMAQTIMMADKTNPSVQINVIHLPAFRSPWTKDVKMAAFMPLLLRDLQRSPKRFMCGDGYQRIPSDEDIRWGLISRFRPWDQQVCTTSTHLYNLVVTYYLLLTQYFPWVL